MCGIFGYIGKKDSAAEIVLDGLKTLEYRGYDSWGVAVKNNQTIEIEKHVGKIGDAKINLPKSTLSIGHTRWATHGGVTQTNAHPHLDCTKQIAVLHNGIVENYIVLKAELQDQGHTFVSETDTEVIAHLIEELAKTQDFQSAVRNAFNKLQGLNAIVVLHAASDEIIAAKNGSPLIVGKGEGETFLASDASGIIKYTRNLLFIKDHEMVVLGDEIKLFGLPNGEVIKPEFETINWKIEDADMGDYPHFMIKEIYEQPKVIRNIALNYADQVASLVDTIANAKGTFFIAAGTAYHACLAGVYLFSKVAKIHVNTAIASEFNYLEDFINEKSLIIAFSQSGETIDIVEPLNAIKKKGSTIVSVVNSLGSTIYRMGNYKILLGAGPEKAVASTKAYTAKVALLIMLAYTTSLRAEMGKNSLLAAADEIERLVAPDQIDTIKKLAKTLEDQEHMYVVGRGISYPAALEAALKIKEVSYVHTEGLAGGELKHGTIALISKGIPCMVFAPNDETYDAMISNATEIKARGGLIIGISHKPNQIFDHYIEVKDCGEASIVAQLIPAQLLAYYLALNKGYDPDKPRNLAKSVTVK